MMTMAARPNKGPKKITEREADFAKLLEEVGFGAVEAYRKAFNTRVEDPKSQQKARDLARSVRVKQYRVKIKEQLERQREARRVLTSTGKVDLDRLRDFAFERLVQIRDDSTAKSNTRLKAVRALEALHDPSRDEALILKWAELAWRYQEAHCPACHNDFPLRKVKNVKIDQYREEQSIDFKCDADGVYDRRLEIIKLADKRLRPHPDQIRALEALERNIVGTAAARAGKSYLMALFALMAFMIPGVEIWLLARTYEDARSEVEYLRKFLRNLFHPYYDLMVKEYDDKKSGELTFISKWGSELKIRSAKSKGSITGRELELALIAEPAWVDGSIFNHLRARMSSRLGRILAFGTPQGTSGMIGRLVRQTGRDEDGRIIRRSPEERLIKNGCPWNTSMLVYALNPRSNPGFVQSELDAARQEMTDEEYAGEFEGRMDLWEGRKFHVNDSHLVKVPRDYFEEAVYVLGIDQGPKNFGAILTAYNGEVTVPCWEYFNGDEKTMQNNLIKLRREVPRWITKLGGDPNNWKATITDRDPLMDGIFEDISSSGSPWPHDITLRHLNNAKLLENWRRETQEWVNNLARKKTIRFHESDELVMDQDQYPGAALLHDQVVNAMDVPENQDRESKSDAKKGWVVTDPWRADHVVDAWYFTMWMVLSGQLLPNERYDRVRDDDPWAEAKRSAEYSFAKQEQEDMAGGRPINPNEKVKFEDYFGRPRPVELGVPMGGSGHYEDES
jgi:hypothetical protein